MTSFSRFSRLIVGLGNPGRKYHLTRHNVGFLIVDALAFDLGLSFEPCPRVRDVDWVYSDQDQLVIAKPKTYMNRSGRAVKVMLDAFRIPLENLIVVCDDVCLPSGVLRLRARGGDGGHNGLGSMIQVLETQEFSRLRYGVGTEKPVKGADLADFVLGEMTPVEQNVIQKSKNQTNAILKSFIRDGFQSALNDYSQMEKHEKQKEIKE